MRLPTGLLKHRKASFKRALVVTAFLFAGGGEGAALALLSADPARSGPRPPALAAAVVSVTAAPTPLEGERAVGRGGREYYRKTTSRRVAASTEKSFMALYREAARAFGVSWRLIASIHRQETAFSSVPGTYHGLNAFGCCAGPMQFNVTNGPPSTWALYRDAFRQGRRPRRYPHRARSHPSVYDDFDAMMAAGALLRDAGAGEVLDGATWSAAYAYYGHDLFGIDYANQVLGRAQGWDLYGFCLNCPLDEVLVDAFEGAYGSDARRRLLAAKDLEEREKRSKRKPSEKAGEAKRPKSPRDSADRDEGATLTPPLPDDETAPPPEPESATTQPPAATEPPPQPAAPPPAATEDCTRLERLLGCGRAGA